jgi:hypothetical protein
MQFNSQRFPRGSKPLPEEGETAMQTRRRRLGPAGAKRLDRMDYVHKVLKSLPLERITRDLPERVKRTKKPGAKKGVRCSFYCIESGHIKHGILQSCQKKEVVTYCVVKTSDGVEHFVTMRGLFAAFDA